MVYILSMAISINPNLFQIPIPFLLPPPPPSPSPSPSPSVKPSHPPMLYYNLIVVGTAAFVLALYNLIVIKWCSNNNNRRRENQLFDSRANQSFESMNLGIVSSFKCSKEEPAAGYECAVCLSIVEEGKMLVYLQVSNHT